MKKFITVMSIIIGVVVLDILSKGYLIYLITGGVPVAGNAWNIVPVPYIMTRVTSFFNIVFTWNPGTSFSMFRAMGEVAPLLLVFATGVIIGFIGYYLARRARRDEVVPLALIMGGAIGNLVDRIRFGAVVDFLDFHIGTWHYPSFNIADICIVVGVGLYLLNWVLIKYRGK